VIYNNRRGYGGPSKLQRNIMGTREDIIEEIEAEILAERANNKGMTVAELVDYDEHWEKMSAGRRFYEQRDYEDRMIAYYLKNPKN
jgi:hypothetical protein